MSKLLANKHAAIVGGTGALGLPIAKLFAHHGARLTILSRSAAERQTQLQRDLGLSQQQQHRFIPLDVLDANDIERKFKGKGGDDGVGDVDLLVNCAGISQTTLLSRTRADEVQRIINMNLTSTMLACKFAKVEAKGCIINVSSLMAQKATIGSAVYSAAKAGVIGKQCSIILPVRRELTLLAFNKALCLEFQKRPVRVNALLPGWVESQMWNGMSESPPLCPIIIKAKSSWSGVSPFA